MRKTHPAPIFKTITSIIIEGPAPIRSRAFFIAPMIPFQRNVMRSPVFFHLDFVTKAQLIQFM